MEDPIQLLPATNPLASILQHGRNLAWPLPTVLPTYAKLHSLPHTHLRRYLLPSARWLCSTSTAYLGDLFSG